MNILVVEDNPVNQKIISQLLSRWGMHVTLASDGKEATNIVREKKFDLIVMDINMPEMDGCEATSYIRSLDDPYFKTIPILAFTASTLADTKQKAEKLGMNDCLSKPINPEEMHLKISQYAVAPQLEYRPLQVKFDVYADCDPDFKVELAVLMITNIRDLQQAAFRSYYTGDIKSYPNVSHKVKSTLLLLDDQEFTFVVNDLKDAFLKMESHAVMQQKINKFNHLSESIIKTLDKEINILKAAS
jgi:CheY-like chemotaxis protein